MLPTSLYMIQYATDFLRAYDGALTLLVNRVAVQVGHIILNDIQ